MSNDTYHPPHYREPLLPLQEIRPITTDIDGHRLGSGKQGVVNHNPKCPCFDCPHSEEEHDANESCETYRYYAEHGSIKELGRTHIKRSPEQSGKKPHYIDPEAPPDRKPESYYRKKAKEKQKRQDAHNAKYELKRKALTDELHALGGKPKGTRGLEGLRKQIAYLKTKLEKEADMK